MNCGVIFRDMTTGSWPGVRFWRPTVKIFPLFMIWEGQVGIKISKVGGGMGRPRIGGSGEAAGRGVPGILASHRPGRCSR